MKKRSEIYLRVRACEFLKVDLINNKNLLLYIAFKIMFDTFLFFQKLFCLVYSLQLAYLVSGILL